MIVVFSNKQDEYDFIILTSIKYAMSRIKGGVVKYSPTLDFSGDDELAILGHGFTGGIEQYWSYEIAEHMKDPAHGVPSTLKKVLITSCYAGVDHPKYPQSSVVDQVVLALRAKGVAKGTPVSGAMGPSIKANIIGEHFKVIPEGGKEMDLAGAAQTFFKSQNPHLADHSASFSSSFQMQIAASAAERASRSFYTAFVGMLESQRAAMDPASAMRTEYV